MTKWEYTVFEWEGRGRGKKRYVQYSHRSTWDKIASDQLMEVFRILGDEGWELVGQENTLRVQSINFTPWKTWWFKRPLAEVAR
jgi:hypothetical protein